MKVILFLLLSILLHSSYAVPRTPISHDFYNAFVETIGLDAYITDEGIDCSKVVRVTLEGYKANLQTHNNDVDTVILSVLSLIDTFKFELSPECRVFIGDFESFMSQYYGNVETLKVVVERNLETYNIEIIEMINQFLEALRAGDEFGAGQASANALKLFIGVSKPEIIFGGADFNSGQLNKFNNQVDQTTQDEFEDFDLDDDLDTDEDENEPSVDADGPTGDYVVEPEDKTDDDENDKSDEYIKVVFVSYDDDSDQTMGDEDFDDEDYFDNTDAGEDDEGDDEDEEDSDDDIVYTVTFKMDDDDSSFDYVDEEPDNTDSVDQTNDYNDDDYFAYDVNQDNGDNNNNDDDDYSYTFGPDGDVDGLEIKDNDIIYPDSPIYNAKYNHINNDAQDGDEDEDIDDNDAFADDFGNDNDDDGASTAYANDASDEEMVTQTFRGAQNYKVADDYTYYYDDDDNSDYNPDGISRRLLAQMYYDL